MNEKLSTSRDLILHKSLGNDETEFPDKSKFLKLLSLEMPSGSALIVLSIQAKYKVDDTLMI